MKSTILLRYGPHESLCGLKLFEPESLRETILNKWKSSKLIFKMCPVRMGYVCCSNNPQISFKVQVDPFKWISKDSCFPCICSGFQNTGLYNNFVSTNDSAIAMAAKNRHLRNARWPSSTSTQKWHRSQACLHKVSLNEILTKNSKIYHKVPAFTHTEA